ncbi:MAG: heparinase II/III family protein [Bacillota bacterium]|nr:heparinase II/III family protein [Bacillota bacterium]
MSFLVTKNEIDRFLESQADDIWLQELWKVMQERTRLNTQELSICQSADTQEWWHLVWDRMSDAAFVYYVLKDAQVGRWIHLAALDICRKDAAEWIGPWFRNRTNPPIGMLETAHACVAVATALDLCADLFTDQEIRFIRQSLKEKGQEPCLRFLQNGHRNNWFMVLLLGYTMASAALGEKENLPSIAEYYRTACTMYNQDSYGESVQYWNYATLTLSRTYETLIRIDPRLSEDLPVPYISCIPWACASLMYMKPLPGWTSGKNYPRNINFGDCAAIYRISGDIALQIAARFKDSHPTEAGLARWLFETGYQDSDLMYNERATFGFFNNFEFYTLLHYPSAAPVMTPDEAELARSAVFDVGHIIVRDRFDNPTTVWAMAGGYEPLNVSSHRHADQNSFTVAHLNERFMVDGGHCTYRLPHAQGFNLSSKNHNTWRFYKMDGTLIDQKPVGLGSPLNHRTAFVTDGTFTAIASDAAQAYGPPVIKAERMIVSVLPNALFIIDTIEADEPVRVEENFLLNNRDNKLKLHVASDTRLVFRRGQAAIKLIQTSAEPATQFSLGWGYVHDAFHPLPNQNGQGKEGSGLIFTHTSAIAARKHVLVYAIPMAAEAAIKQWHVNTPEPGVSEIESPAGDDQYRVCIKLSEEGVLVSDSKANKEWRVKPSR